MLIFQTRYAVPQQMSANGKAMASALVLVPNEVRGNGSERLRLLKLAQLVTQIQELLCRLPGQTLASASGVGELWSPVHTTSKSYNLMGLTSTFGAGPSSDPVWN